MGWSTPRTASVGDIYTAPWYNTDTRDDLNEAWHEMAYTEYTAAVSIVATTEATANTIVTASSFTARGTVLHIQYYCPQIDPPTTSGATSWVWLYEDGTSIGYICDFNIDNHDVFFPCVAERYHLPSAGSHTYSIRSSVNGAITYAHRAGLGGLATLMPGYIRILQKG